MPLENIDLSPEDTEELREQLEAWKQGVINKVEAELTSKYEEMESALKEEYEALVEDIRDKMKRVFTKRFVTALKEMYDQIKAEVLAESLDSPEIKVLESIKTLVYPLVNGSEAERYVSEFAKMAEINEDLTEELALTKGKQKLLELTQELSDDVKKVVITLVGEGTEEEVVERFAAIKEALVEKKEVEFDEEPGLEPDEEEEEEEEEKPRKKKKKAKKSKEQIEKEQLESEDEDEEEEEEPEEEEEELDVEENLLKSKTGDIVVEEEKREFNDILSEMLELAGVPKKE